MQNVEVQSIVHKSALKPGRLRHLVELVRQMSGGVSVCWQRFNIVYLHILPTLMTQKWLKTGKVDRKMMQLLEYVRISI